MPFERTDAGITIQTFEEIRAELSAEYTNPVTGIDPALDVSDESLFGRLIALDAAREASLQQQIVAVYSDTTVAATGIALTRLAQITGTIRTPAQFSTVTLDMVLTAPLAAGSRVSDTTGAILFETIEDLASTGSVLARAVDPGVVIAPANTLTVKVSSPSGLGGWTSVTNPLAAEPGSEVESDPDLRLRRAQEVNRGGSSNFNAILTEVRAVSGALSVGGLNDTTNHVFEVVVFGPTAEDDAIAQAIWDNAPAGIAAVSLAGTPDSGVAVDSEGDSHVVEFSRGVEVPVYIQVEILVNDQYPADGDDQVEAALTAALNSYVLGQDVIQTRLYAPVYSVPGLVDVTDLFLGTAPSPSTTDNIEIGYAEVAQPATIVVVSTPV